jgi:2,4-dienoyl-CoA reductase-like NADH-dependent reductase (Old Yellow Enzyme family)
LIVKFKDAAAIEAWQGSPGYQALMPLRDDVMDSNFLVLEEPTYKPGLFDQYSLKSATLRNRIVVSPMCQYMAKDGVVNDWHRAHYASLARGGAGLVIVEATAVSPEGRVTWGDLGLWNDDQAKALEAVVTDIVKAGAVPGIQIAHAGRKASANLPWEGDDHIPLGEANSWQTIGPSAVPFGASLPRVPEEMSLDEIARVQNDTVKAAARARDAGFQWLQMHFAHGYLAQNFFSPCSNKRTDQYGGSAENRARYLLETFIAVRKVWPEDRPLTIRFSVVTLGRPLLAEPHWPHRAAQVLGVLDPAWKTLPPPYAHWLAKYR